MSRGAPAEKSTRRRFLEQLSSCGLLSLNPQLWADTPWLAALLDQQGPVTCGPPPRAKPHSRTGGESFPPLPLPVTPLRRTERKRPPAPPALIGKAALGPIRWMTRNGKRVAYRDWMTDPSDVQTLLEWTNRQLGIRYRAVETNFGHFGFDPRELPALLFAGHNGYRLGDALAARLRRFVLDGGMLIGDACCGWKDFDQAFRAMVQSIFPDVPLKRLAPDEPLLAAFYKLRAVRHVKADGSTYEGEPELYGVRIGCRLGLVYSPVDLTCGWDGHTHPRGLRVAIGPARQIGANYVTYLIASYQLGRFFSTMKVYHEASAPTRDDFVLVQLEHSGDWDPDPSAVFNLLKFARDNTTLEVKFKKITLPLDDPRIAQHPLLYMTGHDEFVWTAEQAGRLRAYLQAGGMLLADACCGRLGFDRAFRRELRKVLPDAKLEPIPLDHPIYHLMFDVSSVRYTPRTLEDFGDITQPSLEGISLKGKLAVIYSRFDLGNGWEQFPHPYSYGYSADDALRIGTNVLAYAVTH